MKLSTMIAEDCATYRKRVAELEEALRKSMIALISAASLAEDMGQADAAKFYDRHVEEIRKVFTDAGKNLGVDGE